MRRFTLLFVAMAMAALSNFTLAQKQNAEQKATLIITSEPVLKVPSLATQIANGTFIPGEDIEKEFNPKQWGKNVAVPGKGFPKGVDPLWEQQQKAPKTPGKAPILTFEAASATATPTDPTGAVGPNHFVNSWNSSFRIWDKAGNPLTAVASLQTIFPGTMGDPIVMYDRYADRFFISEFYETTSDQGFDVAVSQGPDPVNDGWYVYRFSTNTFPDYPKYSIWSDAYYITANKNQTTAGTSEVVFALERDKMLSGDPTAQMVGFPLTDIVTNGFYSPLGFNCNGSTLPPPGNAPIVYMQDDVWTDVSTDHLKVWNINVDWTTPSNSTISTPQIINTTPFDGLFDGGSFVNLPQPSGSDIDALQATIMYMAQYRRFPTYNTVVFNFVVDLDGNDDHAGIRWYELRQPNDGDPWTIYQEGTYAQPDGHSAFSGNMCMDGNGNIALAYTVVSSSIVPCLRYTGRLASDPLGTMTMSEEVIKNGTSVDPYSRYGDYSQMTIDPTDDATFWSIGEVFVDQRDSWVGTFMFAPPALTAAFSGSPTAVCTGSTVTFTDQSLGSPTSWDWTFNGGTPSSYSGQNPPAVTYNTPGTYDVSLTVGDGTDTHTETKTGYITVNDVIADFAATPETVIVGNTITFTDLSGCAPTGWEWSFPGGTPSTYSGQNPPAILYDTEGTYDVTLTVTKGSASDVMTKTGYITVVPPVFTIQNGSITTCQGTFYDSGGASGSYSNGEDYIFTIYSATPGAQLEVNFTTFDVEYQGSCNYDYLNIYNGENTSATQIGEYCGTSSPGLVTSSNAAGALTFEWHSDGLVTNTGWAATISCSTNPPVADFSASNTIPLINTDVIFTDLSSGGPSAWQWTFSPNNVIYINGTNANSQNPEVQFTQLGSYDVTLEVTGDYGTDTEIKTGYIIVVDAPLCTYCPSSFTNTSDDWISNVSFNTIQNPSGSVGYEDYTGISTEIEQGMSYPIDIEVTVSGSWNQYIWVWFDWNLDCDFDDPNEAYYIGTTPGTAGTFILSGSVDIPADAIPGISQMRVIERYSQDPGPCDVATWGETEDYTVIVKESGFRVELTAFLEGPYNPGTGFMETTLNNSGFVPGSQPYNPVLPYYNNNDPVWLYTGTETVGTVPVDAVDWVVVQLRDADVPGNATSATILDTQAAFIRSDGAIVGMDGVSNLLFDVTVSQNLYVVLFHRNHLGIISANALTETGGIYSYDFTSASTQTYGGTNAVKELEPGVWGMVAADGDANGLIQNTDETTVWKADLGSSGYTGGDFDMNGLTQNTDETDVWKPNLGGGGQVPAKTTGSGFKSFVPW